MTVRGMFRPGMRGYLVPLAAGLYLLTTTTWSVIERAVLRREQTG